jgi:hypothetical protein
MGCTNRQLACVIMMILLIIKGHECKKGNCLGESEGGKKQRILRGEEDQNMLHIICIYTYTYIIYILYTCMEL